MANMINVTVKGQDLSSIECEFRTVVLKSYLTIGEQLESSNTKYVVKWNYDLNGNTLIMPADCIFDFDGGKISNGSIVWNNTKILNRYQYTILEGIEESGTKIEL